MNVGSILIIAVMWSNTGLEFMSPRFFPGPAGMLPCMGARLFLEEAGTEALEARISAELRAEHGRIESWKAACFPMMIPVPGRIPKLPPFKGKPAPDEDTISI